MAASFSAFFGKRRLAVTRAKLRAWWEGEPFDEAVARAAIGAQANDEGLAEAPEPSPRLKALAMAWGEGRIRPGDPAYEALAPQRMGVPPGGALALMGPGLVGPLVAVTSAHPCRVDVFEWREETVDVLARASAKLPRVEFTRIDLETHEFPQGVYDGVLSVDDFTYARAPSRLARQIRYALKPGACAIVECYAGAKKGETAAAFASSFAHPQIRAHGELLQHFAETGLALEADEDVTEDWRKAARRCFARLAARLAAHRNVEAGVARELAREAEAWRRRLALMAQGRLARRRLVLRKPAWTLHAGNAKAPAG